MTLVTDGETPTLAQLILRRGLEARGARARVDPDIHGREAMTETGARLRGVEQRFGEFVAGRPNGCGKTTTLGMIASLRGRDDRVRPEGMFAREPKQSG